MYVQETGPDNMIPNDEHHYEFDPDNKEPYWEPSSREDELKIQIQMLRMDVYF